MSVRRLAEEQPASFEFTPENLAWVNKQIAKYPEGRQASAVIPLLWQAQKQHNYWLPKPAIEKLLGIDLNLTPELTVVENTPARHHVICCTLCSCYPRAVLGIPPAWYKSPEYRSRVVREPREVLAEFGTRLPDNVEIRVVDSTADMRYMVLPLRPANTAGMSEEQLAAIVTRDSMIGVSVLGGK